MAYFKDDQEVYQYIGKLFQDLADDPELSPKFRKADTIVRCLEAELYFYGAVFAFTIADSVDPPTIDNLPRPSES